MVPLISQEQTGDKNREGSLFLLAGILLSDGFSFLGFLLKQCLEFFPDAGFACLGKHECCPVRKLAVVACLAILEALRIDFIGFIGMFFIPGF
ncbi:hypothetical protein ABW09_24355 [Pluralibacter gergoviae]|nr:hypothetical protein ABW09_24355 [Pluralibacter gergoviae]